MKCCSNGDLCIWQGREHCGKRTKYLLKAFSLLLIIFESLLFTLSQTTNFWLLQTERLCRRQFLIWSQWQKVLQKGRKHCEKSRNCSLQAISPFPTLFSKNFYCRHVKTRACLGMGWGSLKLVIVWWANRWQNFKFLDFQSTCRQQSRCGIIWS